MTHKTNKHVSYSDDECVWVIFAHVHSRDKSLEFPPMYTSNIVNYSFACHEKPKYPMRNISCERCFVCEEMRWDVACFIPKYKVTQFIWRILDYDYIAFNSRKNQRCILYANGDVYGFVGCFQFVIVGDPMYDYIGSNRVLFS